MVNISDKKRLEYLPKFLEERIQKQRNDPYLTEVGARLNIGIINDGNRRWAKRMGLSPADGYKAGEKAGREIVKACIDFGVKELSAFLSSTENIRYRSAQELDAVLKAGMDFIRRMQETEGVALNLFGDFTVFPPDVQDFLQAAQEQNLKSPIITVHLGINYGGIWDLTTAAKGIAREVRQGGIEPDQINAEVFFQHLSTYRVKPLDLLIRAGGRYSLSNFLLAQTAYTELYVSPTLWPDFTIDEFKKALEWFFEQKRQFGG